MGNSSNTKINSPSFQHAKLKGATLSASSKNIVVDCLIPQNYQEWHKKYQNIIKINQTKAIFIPEIQQTQKDNFCGTEKSLKLIFEMFPYTLEKQIKKRQKNNHKFTQQQLWYLLYQLLLASSVFQQKRQKSGDIRPKNVLINQQGHINLVTSISFPEQVSTNYYKSFIRKEKTFLAPQQLAQLQGQMKYCRSDPVVAESFSIGLTVMDAALLFDSEDLYDVKNIISFKNYKYNDNLVAFKSLSLSPFFIKTVINLLEVKPFDRPSPGETLAILRPYQSYIIELQEFAPDRQKSKASLQEFQSNSWYGTTK